MVKKKLLNIILQIKMFETKMQIISIETFYRKKKKQKENMEEANIEL